MSVEYGKSYTDSKTQSQMMRFLKASSRLTGMTRRGRSKPSTQLNRDPHPKHDAEYENPLALKANKGPVKGSNWDERRNEKPMKVPLGRPRNTSKVNRRYK